MPCSKSPRLASGFRVWTGNRPNQENHTSYTLLNASFSEGDPCSLSTCGLSPSRQSGHIPHCLTQISSRSPVVLLHCQDVKNLVKNSTKQLKFCILKCSQGKTFLPDQNTLHSALIFCLSYMWRSLTVDSIKEQISKLLGAWRIQEKSFAPLQQFTQGVMYTVHGMEMKLSFRKIPCDIASLEGEHWAKWLCAWILCVHAVSLHKICGSSGIFLSSKPAIWILNFTETAGCRNFVSIQVWVLFYFLNFEFFSPGPLVLQCIPHCCSESKYTLDQTLAVYQKLSLT